MRPGGVHRPFVPPGRKQTVPLAAAAGAAEAAPACAPAGPPTTSSAAAPPAPPPASPRAAGFAPPRPAGFAPPRGANGAGFAPPRPAAGAAAARPAAPADALPDEYYTVCYCKKSNKVQRQHKGFAVRSLVTHALSPLGPLAPFALLRSYSATSHLMH